MVLCRVVVLNEIMFYPDRWSLSYIYRRHDLPSKITLSIPTKVLGNRSENTYSKFEVPCEIVQASYRHLILMYEFIWAE